MKQIIDELKQDKIDKNHIIYLNFESKEYSFIQNDDRGVTKNTLYNYLEYMVKAMLISKAERFDLRGKRIRGI